MSSPKNEGPNSASYRIEFTRNDDGAWTASVDGSGGAIARGQSFRHVRHRAEQVFVRSVPAAAGGKVDLVLHLPAPMQEALRRASASRAIAAEALRLADEATAVAAALLVRECGMTMADAAQALGLSRRHLQLLLSGAPEQEVSTPK